MLSNHSIDSVPWLSIMTAMQTKAGAHLAQAEKDPSPNDSRT